YNTEAQQQKSNTFSHELYLGGFYDTVIAMVIAWVWLKNILAVRDPWSLIILIRLFIVFIHFLIIHFIHDKSIIYVIIYIQIFACIELTPLVEVIIYVLYFSISNNWQFNKFWSNCKTKDLEIVGFSLFRPRTVNFDAIFWLLIWMGLKKHIEAYQSLIILIRFTLFMTRV
ncbi:hypothetical protein ACJX0J_007887, partial [Zea mays]